MYNNCLIRKKSSKQTKKSNLKQIKKKYICKRKKSKKNDHKIVFGK